jgi:hypothetical protein
VSSTGSDFPEPGDHRGPGDRPSDHRTDPIPRWPFDLEAEDVEGPHVVVTLDTRTGCASFSGPYRTALAALCAADVEYQVDRDQGGRGELTFHVAALETPIGSDDVDPLGGAAVAAPAVDATGPWAQALALLGTVAERAIGRRGRGRLTAGTVAVTAGALLPGVTDGWVRRARTTRHRPVLGRGPR